MNAPLLKARDKFTVFVVLMGALLFSLAPPVRADDVSVSLTTNVAGSAGDTITVFGSLTNDTTSTYYFSDDAINLAAPTTAATASDDLIIDGFLGLEPVFIAPGATLDNVDLFTISLAGSSGTYTGNSFVLIGGTDPNACSLGTAGCDTQLGSAAFDLTVGTPVATPEPGTLLLLSVGLAALAFVGMRKTWDRCHRCDA